MRGQLRPLSILLFLLAACRSVAVTPAALREARVPEAERAQLVQTWTRAVERCNEFLDSPFRHALPLGRFELDDARGMRFETERGTWPIEVSCTSWGDFVQWFGFAAQEGEGGFTVGDCEPERDRVADNALFRSENGFAIDPDLVADLILHETTHVVYREGAIGFGKSLSYYLEALFLFRYGRTHSDERRAYSTAEEYHYFIQSVGQPEARRAQLLKELDEHIVQSVKKTCRHGPPADPPPPAILRPNMKG